MCSCSLVNKKKYEQKTVERKNIKFLFVQTATEYPEDSGLACINGIAILQTVILGKENVIEAIGRAFH